jgi:hypothetical protein
MSDNQDQPEEQIPEQQSAEDTTPWDNKPVIAPDGSKHIRTKNESE